MGLFNNVFAATGLGGLFGVESDAEKGARRAGEIQAKQARSSAGDVQAAGDLASSRFDQFAPLGQRGIDLAGFLADPNAQFDFLQNNPLFQLGLDNANQVTQQSAAARGRLTSGDTLQQLNNNSLLVAQPLINRQRQDILNLLGIGQNTAASQGQIDQNTAANVANLLTGGAAAQAGGIVGAANASTQNTGNLLDLAGLAVGAPSGTFSSLFSSTQPTQPVQLSGYGSGLNLSNTPLGINTNAGSFGFRS